MPTRQIAAFIILGILAVPALGASPFADRNLDAAVRAVLLDPKGDLTEEMLKNVFILHAAGKGIKDLSGLEKCKNLAELDLAKNQIGDIKALKDLTNIQSLTLSDNQITDIAPLAGL